jgi:2-dehydro-3-deoxy-D-arabinonate dehydratase
MSIRLYKTTTGVLAEHHGLFHPLPDEWDSLVNHADLATYLASGVSTSSGTQMNGRILAPIGEQEVWAAGVTYERSRSARLEESKAAGGGSFYDRVYDAERPELFFKSVPWRVRGPRDDVRIRRDAAWSVPEPEIALCVNNAGRIVGYTIGNDMSSRDIEGENPLYLPQAKIYDGSCSLGPALLVSSDPLPRDTVISLEIMRAGATVFSGSTPFSRMRRDPASLVEFLFRETSFPRGAFLLTGTGIVPPDEFRLCAGDTVKIHVPPIGTLINTVGAR